MKDKDIHHIVKILEHEVQKFKTPAIGEIQEKFKDPFKVLVSCILSLRTKDEVTREASKRLFEKVNTPKDILKLTEKQIEKIIYPVGFYRRKAKVLKQIAKILLDKFNGKVPDSLEELLLLPGVGRKTANLVLTVGYNKYGICVDTHVHRIVNRLGYVKTNTPEQTEKELRKKLPKKYWIRFNDLLVTWGQNVCTPVSPKCSICLIERYCDKIGVKRNR